MQSETSVPPLFTLYLPLGQSVHELASAGEYLPGSHSGQLSVAAALDAVPAGQLWQVAMEVAPSTVEKNPAPHAVQSVDVVEVATLLYFPFGQSVQTLSLISPVPEE